MSTWGTRRAGGILIAYIVGFALMDLSGNWRWMLGLGAVPGLVLAVSMIFVPHTPRWLVSKGRVTQARAVLKQTRTGDASKELGSIQETVSSQRRHRSKAMAVSTIFNWAANSVVSYFFLQEVALIGKPLTFWIYAVLGLLAIGFVWWKVPGTRGKSLEQIEREVGAAPSADR